MEWYINDYKAILSMKISLLKIHSSRLAKQIALYTLLHQPLIKCPLFEMTDLFMFIIMFNVKGLRDKRNLTQS